MCERVMVFKSFELENMEIWKYKEWRTYVSYNLLPDIVTFEESLAQNENEIEKKVYFYNLITGKWSVCAKYLTMSLEFSCISVMY